MRLNNVIEETLPECQLGNNSDELQIPFNNQQLIYYLSPKMEDCH